MLWSATGIHRLSSTVLHSYRVFFFQAEDGIRDLTVTGVQTCALPICHVQVLLAEPTEGAPGGHAAKQHGLAHGRGKVRIKGDGVLRDVANPMPFSEPRDRKSVV